MSQKSALSPQPSALSPQQYPLKRLTKSFFLCLFAILTLTGIATAAPNSCFIYSIDDPASGFNEWASTRQEACQKYYKFVRPSDPNFIFYEGTMIRISDEGEIFIPATDLDNQITYCGIKAASIQYPLSYVYGLAKFTKWDYGSCGQTLTLTPALNQKDPRPLKAEGKDGKSTLELIATVMEGSTPKAGVAVTFKVEVKEGSGEHSVTSNGAHVHADRPKGKLTSLADKTNASGEIRTTFNAEILAGTHTVTATCNDCSNKTATKDVKVLVPDLVELTADTGTPRTFALVGNTNYPGTNHPSNHYFTDPALNTLRQVVKTMYNSGWGVVGVNDGSLRDGGLFDIKGLWTPSHFEHRTGTEVDLSFTNPKRIGSKDFERVYGELCKKENAAFDIQTLWHKADGLEPHFHMYLNGTGLRADAGGRCCAQVKAPKKDKDGNPVLDKKGNPVIVKICE